MPMQRPEMVEAEITDKFPVDADILLTIYLVALGHFTCFLCR